MNEFDREIVSDKKYFFRNTSEEIDTVDSQQSYDMPNNLGSLINTTVTVDTTIHTPKEVTSQRQWDTLNSSTSEESDTPSYYFINSKKIELYPTPVSDGNTITFNYQKNYKDLTVADYTAGTIVTATNGGTAIVGDSTVWTAKMADRWIRITDSNTANTGDGVWYEIDSITDATHLVLKKNYQGISIAAGAGACTVGQISIIPEAYQKLTVFKALEIYFTSIQPEENRALLYKRLADEGQKKLDDDQTNKSSSPVVSEIGRNDIINPNLFVSG